MGLLFLFTAWAAVTGTAAFELFRLAVEGFCGIISTCVGLSTHTFIEYVLTSRMQSHGTIDVEGPQTSLQPLELFAQTLALLTDVGRLGGEFLDLLIVHIIDDLTGDHSLQRLDKAVFNGKGGHVVDKRDNRHLCMISISI
jgi:hypothetical protein